jgi:hypothetical protein
MDELLLRERVFDAACFLVGKAGRVFDIEIKNPVFIIGTGRCGTTLLVDMLDTHRGLAGFPGEANELWHPRLEPFESSRINIPPIEIDPKRYSEISVSAWPGGHGEKIRDIFRGFHILTGTSKAFFTKSAMISFLIPDILKIFPDAKFIHVYRYGPSVVESYFKKNFGKYSKYKYAERDYRLYCAKYWNDCILEIDRRNKELALEAGGQFLEFSYEYLCENPRKVLDSLAAYFGIAPENYKFDISEVSSQNYKAEKYSGSPEAIELLEVMSQGMKLKGYMS